MLRLSPYRSLAFLICLATPAAAQDGLVIEMEVSPERCAADCQEMAESLFGQICGMAYYFIAGPRAGTCLLTEQQEPDLQMSGTYEIYSSYYQRWLNNDLIAERWPGVAGPIGRETPNEDVQRLVLDDPVNNPAHCDTVGDIPVRGPVSSGTWCADRNLSNGGWDSDRGWICNDGTPIDFVEACEISFPTSLGVCYQGDPSDPNYKYNTYCVVLPF